MFRVEVQPDTTGEDFTEKASRYRLDVQLSQQRSLQHLLGQEVKLTPTFLRILRQILATIPGAPDLSTVTLTNKPVNGEILPIEVLKGRKVKDMGFG